MGGKLGWYDLSRISCFVINTPTYSFILLLETISDKVGWLQKLFELRNLN